MVSYLQFQAIVLSLVYLFIYLLIFYLLLALVCVLYVNGRFNVNCDSGAPGGL